MMLYSLRVLNYQHFYIQIDTILFKLYTYIYNMYCLLYKKEHYLKCAIHTVIKVIVHVHSLGTNNKTTSCT